MNSLPARLHAGVFGLVQGVNFRAATRDQARTLGLVGWVRNRMDGSVEVMAEGPRSDLDQLLAYLHHGPQLAEVERVEAGWQVGTGEFTRFEIRF